MDETIDKGNMSDHMSDENQTILSDAIFSTPQKLTPTGKISHAKTRVYTQRYRKEWEQMADFKGWLTSVDSQPTRAFCIYCKKDLHAHRLSLLKHTCTMKHQRAALLAQNERRNRNKNHNEDTEELDKQSEIEGDFEEVTVVSAIKSLSNDDDDMEEFEYVVESLEIEDNDAVEEIPGELQEEEILKGHGSLNNSSSIDVNHQQGPQMKKIKLEHYPRRDALAEAMAHVHGEYLDQEEDHSTLELDMEVESESTNVSDKIEDTVVIHNENSTSQKEIGANCSSSEANQKSKIITYKLNSPNISTVNLQGINAITIGPNQQNKTLTLNNGRTVTLNTSKVIGGAQYVLSKVKGNLSTLVMAGSKNGNAHRALVPKTMIKTSPSHSSCSGPQANTMADLVNASDEPITKLAQGSANCKNPCISTHVLDTTKGTPVAGLQVSLYKLMDGRWTFLNESTTNTSGRCMDLINTTKYIFTAGRYKMHFDVEKYFALRRIDTIYPFIEIVFDVKNTCGNYHIPMLLSPYGYTTYRGSDR